MRVIFSSSEEFGVTEERNGVEIGPVALVVLGANFLDHVSEGLSIDPPDIAVRLGLNRGRPWRVVEQRQLTELLPRLQSPSVLVVDEHVEFDLFWKLARLGGYR